MATELSISIVASAAIGGAIRAFTQLGSSINSLRSSANIATAEHRRLGRQIDNAMTTGAGNVGRLIGQYYRLGDSIRAVNRNVNLRTNIQTGIANQREARSGLMGQAMDLVGIGATVVVPVKHAIEFESSMADVKKVVEFDTPEQFKQMEQDILKLSHTIPMAGKELASIAASGGQLGVARSDIAGFTETVAKMSVAFDMSAETAGDAMAKLANIYQIPITNIGQLGDAINHLSNSSPAKASNIVETLGRVGGVAKQFGLTELQTASLTNAFISLGKSPEVAGTAINGMLTKLMTAEKGTKQFQGALKNMGISAKELKQDIAENGERALMDFLKRIQSIPKADQMGVLVDLFGLEYADDVATLIGGLDQYEKSIHALQATAKDGSLQFMGSMEKEFAARSATTANAIQTLKNKLTHLSITIGSVVLPVIIGLIDKISPVVTKLIEWASVHPAVVKGILTTVGALFAFRASSIAVRLILNSFSLSLLSVGSQALGFVGVFQRLRLAVNLFSMGRTISALRIFGLSSRQALTIVRSFQKGIALLGTALGHLGSLGSVFNILRVAAIGFGKALLTTPIGWLTLALAGVAFLVYKYWTPISSFFMGVWDGIKTGLEPLKGTFDEFLGALSGLWQSFNMAFAPVAEMLGGLWASIAPLVAPIIDWFGEFFAQSQMAGDGARSMGQTVGTVIMGIVSVVVLVASTIIGVWSGALSTLFTVAGSIWNGVRSLFAVAVAGLRAIIAGFSPVSAFSTAFSAVWGFLSGLVGRFRAFGVNIIQGLIGGIKSMAGAVVGAISSTVGNVAGTAKRMLGINSPSRVFRQFGSWVSEGLAIGIDKGGVKPVSAIGYVASGVTANFGAKMGNLSAQISTSIGQHQERMANAKHQNATQNQGNITIHFNPTINASSDVGKIEKALQISQAEFEKMFTRMQADRLRRAY